EIDAIFDGRDSEALTGEHMTADALAASTWRDEMRSAGEARTQGFARRLMTAGHNGLLVRSFAPGATADDLNLVLWRWDDKAPARLVLIDDEGRLSR
ncbi:MAG: RES domain-containing protein, partial [Rhodoblastus sp.]|nr:RES domain-containing protein [Rhodoblastus sp.]